MQYVHFIGIGGIGMSALARMLLLESKRVSGSDAAPSAITDALGQLGATIFVGHEAAHLAADVDTVVYTLAVADDNPELLEARRRGIRTVSYPELLGEVSHNKFVIAVAGTHGKTTTTAMLAKIFIDAGKSPTVVVGSLIAGPDGSRTNFIPGSSDYFIAEACEYRRSFLQLTPRILVITNIDNDHLDYYRDLADIQSAFDELAARVPPEGSVIGAEEYGHVALPITLRLPGKHNQRNAQAAIAAAVAAGISEAAARESLTTFAGTWRRFEYRGTTRAGTPIYDDYGHHPTEIKATLEAARTVTQGRIFLIFQPHLYSRTRLLWDDFVQVLGQADGLVVVPIYAAREPMDPAVSSERLAAATGGYAAPDFAVAAGWVLARARPEDLILTMGAGDIFKLVDDLV